MQRIGGDVKPIDEDPNHRRFALREGREDVSVGEGAVARPLHLDVLHPEVPQLDLPVRARPEIDSHAGPQRGREVESEGKRSCCHRGRIYREGIGRQIGDREVLNSCIRQVLPRATAGEAENPCGKTCRKTSEDADALLLTANATESK